MNQLLELKDELLNAQEAAAPEAGQAATRSGKQPPVGRGVEGDVRTAQRIFAQNFPKRDALDEQATPAEGERAAATKRKPAPQRKPAPKRKRGGGPKAKPAANADAAAAVKTKAAPKRKGSAAGEAKSTPKRRRGGAAKGRQATAGEPGASAEAGQATAAAQEGTQEAAQEGAPAQATAGGPAAEAAAAAAQEAPPANHRRFRRLTLMPQFRTGPRDIPVDSDCLWLVGRRVGAIKEGKTRAAIEEEGPLALWQLLLHIPKRFRREDLLFDSRIRTNGLEVSLQIRKFPGPESTVRPRQTVEEYSGKEEESVPFSEFRDV